MKYFSHCHESNGLMWCKHPNGSWAPPFPTNPDKKKTPVVKN